MSGVSSRWRIPRWLGPAALMMLAWLPTPPGVGAQTVAAVQGTAWWSQRPGAAPLPDGGVEVAVGFGGEVQSVAAIAVRVDAPVRTVVLILEESEATGSETADLRVCRTDPGSIRGANPGAWEDRPDVDCSSRVPLVRNESTAAWSADVTSLLEVGAATGLAIDPAGREAVPGVPLVPGFSIQLAPPKLLVSAAPSHPTDDTPTQATPTDGTTGPPPAPLADAWLPGLEPEIPVAVDEGFVAPPLQPVSPDTEASMPTTTDVDRQTQVGSGSPEPVSADDLFATGPVPGAAGDARPWWRLVVLVPLSAVVGLGAALGRRLLLEGASTSTAVPA